jgi:hypothetical protein
LFLDSSVTVRPCLNASMRMPSNFRSNVQPGATKRSAVSVAAIGTSHLGMDMAQ